MNKTFNPAHPIFNVQKENDDVISKDILRQARGTGKLNLSNRHLVKWPEEILKLGVAHSDTNDIDMDEKKSDTFKWWEVEPLKYLDMSSNSITEIPAGIKELDSLMTLLLHQNLLCALPTELGNLGRLVTLDLAYNKISEFPSCLSNLKELRNLNLSNNLFKTFPSVIYDLVLLNNLDLSRNSIEEMEPGIGFLTRLSSLNLSQNKLPSVPSDITQCRALRTLNLSNNNITTEGLPELIDMKVEVIQLHYNKLSHLPRLRGCSELKEIHLGFNKIEILIPEDEDPEITSDELSTLSHLQIINLRDNSLKKLPMELSCLRNLIRLDLSNNNLTELPATLGLLPHLENLLVEGNNLRSIRRDILVGGTSRLLAYLKQLLSNDDAETKNEKEIPCAPGKEFPDRFTMRKSRAVSLSSQELCNVPDSVFEEALTVPCNMVDLSKNKLQKVPEGVWLLSKTLNDLNLSQNHLKEIPREIGNCVNLRYLNVANNMLKTLPDEFEHCKRLRELNISFNKLDVIPSCVYDLHAMEILILSDNKITSMDAEKFLELKYLAHLDFSNNDLTSVPPLMGKMTQLQVFLLNGNGLRALRPATLAKGTEAVLAWLRDKIV